MVVADGENCPNQFFLESSSSPYSMPPVDLETLFCGRGESKLFVPSGDPAAEDPDLPPESVQVPIGDELGWVKLNKVFDRGQSTIGNANPKSSRCSSKPKSHSQRPNAGGSILGPRKSTFHGNGSRPLPTLRIFPLNFSVERKPAVPDPGSPKVSCFGSVLSEKEKKLGRRGSAVADEVGCCANLTVILGFSGVFPAVSGEVEDEVSRSTSFSGEEERKTADSAAPELQGMKRFASGRRSGSTVDDAGRLEDGHVVSLEPLDREGAVRGN